MTVPVEDQNSNMCTLFKPVLVNPGGDDKTIRLRHVRTGCYACLWRVGPPFNDCLYTAVPTPDGSGCDVYTIINWEERVAALIAEKQALEEKVAELTSKLEECCGSKDPSTNKYPWMSDTIFPGSWVGFEDLDVFQEFASKSTQITLTEASTAAPDLGEDYTTNIQPNRFTRGMLDGQLVCVVVDVAGLVPNSELARFDPNVWGLFNKSGTSYAARKAN